MPLNLKSNQQISYLQLIILASSLAVRVYTYLPSKVRHTNELHEIPPSVLKPEAGPFIGLILRGLREAGVSHWYQTGEEIPHLSSHTRAMIRLHLLTTQIAIMLWQLI